MAHAASRATEHEGALIEAARRVDEQKRFVSKFKNPYDLLGVRDLPDPDEPLAEEEKELFGIIDGQHTVAEVVEAAPLAEYEAYEALDRMLDANWIEVVGRREPGAGDLSRRILASASPHTSVPREIMVAGLVLAVAVGLHFGSGSSGGRPPPGGCSPPSGGAAVRRSICPAREWATPPVLASWSP